jgi:hypothetical protein
LSRRENDEYRDYYHQGAKTLSRPLPRVLIAIFVAINATPIVLIAQIEKSRLEIVCSRLGIFGNKCINNVFIHKIIKDK